MFNYGTEVITLEKDKIAFYESTYQESMHHQNSYSCNHTQSAPNTCNMLQKDEYSVTLFNDFVAELYVQHSGFTIPAISEKVLPVRVKMSYVQPRL